ncbi:hypothetical protein [Micromonospora sp. NPDC005652]|uniref:hypothetical protein n=1 Tax=Micromonospora sp. NPDC005652 TaxID=3157046 RepID=UPI0033E9A6AF
MTTCDGEAIVEDRPEMTLVCFVDKPSDAVVYATWAALRPGFDLLTPPWPDGSPSGHDQLVQTLAAVETPYAVFSRGACARLIPELVAPARTPPPVHIFLAATSPPSWTSAPVGSAAVSLTLLATTRGGFSAADAMGWRTRWNGPFHIRVFDAGADFLTVLAADVVLLIEEELLIMRPVIPATPSTDHGLPR